MKIYIEQSAEDRVQIIDFGDLSEAPADTEEVVIGNGFNDHFRTYKIVQALKGTGRLADKIDEKTVLPFDVNDVRYTTYENDYLVYYKSLGVVGWNQYNQAPVYELSTDALDTHIPYDGIPDIDSDGVDSCIITVTKKDYLGNILEDNETVYLECSRGKLSVLSVDLVNGVGSVTLTSAPETCVSVVEMKTEVDGETACFLKIQFA